MKLTDEQWNAAFERRFGKPEERLTRIAELEAEAAALRGALSSLQEAAITREGGGVNIPIEIYTQVADALATDAGKRLLDVVEAAKEYKLSRSAYLTTVAIQVKEAEQTLFNALAAYRSTDDG